MLGYWNKGFSYAYTHLLAIRMWLKSSSGDQHRQIHFDFFAGLTENLMQVFQPFVCLILG